MSSDIKGLGAWAAPVKPADLTPYFTQRPACPPCHGMCEQGRSCPAASRHFADEPVADMVLAVALVLACLAVVSVLSGLI